MVVQLYHKHPRQRNAAAKHEDGVDENDDWPSSSSFDGGLQSAMQQRLVGVSRRWKVRNHGAWEPSTNISTETFNDDYFRRVREENRRTLDKLRSSHAQHLEQAHQLLLRGDAMTTELDRVELTLRLLPKLSFSNQHEAADGPSIRPHSWANNRWRSEDGEGHVHAAGNGGKTAMRHSDGLMSSRAYAEVSASSTEKEEGKKDYGLFSGRIGEVRNRSTGKNGGTNGGTNVACSGGESWKEQGTMSAAVAPRSRDRIVGPEDVVKDFHERKSKALELIWRHSGEEGMRRRGEFWVEGLDRVIDEVQRRSENRREDNDRMKHATLSSFVV
mmetsp:Transcript_39350/g.124014  ORF Transcript_39350/g.124014 Transcript_39350/m.124014 type:complete len:329 (-) Transcript_39350:71-1057(-)